MSTNYVSAFFICVQQIRREISLEMVCLPLPQHTNPPIFSSVCEHRFVRRLSFINTCLFIFETRIFMHINLAGNPHSNEISYERKPDSGKEGNTF